MDGKLVELGVGLMAAIMVIREVLNFLDKKKFYSDNGNGSLNGHGAVMNEHVNDVRFAVSKVKEKVDDLHNWHDKRDADGVPLWYHLKIQSRTWARKSASK